MPPLIEANGVAKAFHGVAALRDGRIELRAGSVHALCGGNGAGKSTFLGILTGLLKADSGTVLRDGKPATYHRPCDAIADGIAIITQELSTIFDMTVAENIFLGREPRWGRFLVDQRRMVAQAQALLDRLGFAINAKRCMRSLSLADMQLVEITKAIGCNMRVLIMDEPTSALGEAESAKLFAAIDGLKKHQVGIIYVSHRLADIFTIADTYTVMRDGSFVETGNVGNLDRHRLISLIVGRELNEQARPKPLTMLKPLLRVRGFQRANEFEGIDIDVNEGEIVGIYGLAGAGRSEFANALFGITPVQAGTVELAGKPVRVRHPLDAMHHGIGMAPEDRKLQGLVLCASVKNNITLSALQRLSSWGVIRGMAECAAVALKVQEFSIKAASVDMPVQNLSGGNQQKIVLSKCLSRAPRLLICDEPTRGIDEGAKRQLYEFLSRYVQTGQAVLMISSELTEVLANCHRIYVFKKGRVVACLSAAEASQQQLAHLAS